MCAEINSGRPPSFGTSNRPPLPVHDHVAVELPALSCPLLDPAEPGIRPQNLRQPAVDVDRLLRMVRRLLVRHHLEQAPDRGRRPPSWPPFPPAAGPPAWPRSGPSAPCRLDPAPAGAPRTTGTRNPPRAVRSSGPPTPARHVRRPRRRAVDGAGDTRSASSQLPSPAPARAVSSSPHCATPSIRRPASATPSSATTGARRRPPATLGTTLPSPFSRSTPTSRPWSSPPRTPSGSGWSRSSSRSCTRPRRGPDRSRGDERWPRGHEALLHAGWPSCRSDSRPAGGSATRSFSPLRL